LARLVSSPSLANGALGLQCVDFCVNTPVSVTSDTDPSDVDQRSSSEAAASTDTVLPTPLIEPGRVLRNDSAEVEPDNTADLRTEETPNQTTEETQIISQIIAQRRQWSRSLQSRSSQIT